MTRFVIAFGLLWLAVGTATAATNPCQPEYDESGWLRMSFESTPGVETCRLSPDQAATYAMIGYRFDADAVLLLMGSFAVARYENYNINFYVDDEILPGASLVLDDLDPATGAPATAAPGNCNPTAVEPPLSPMPTDCSLRDFGILFAHSDLLDELREAYPDLNVLGVPANTEKVRIIRRTYLEAPDMLNTPPAPQWCNLSSGECTALGTEVPLARLPYSDPAFHAGGEQGEVPSDPCAGAEPGSCAEVVPMYLADLPVPPNKSGVYLGTNLSKLGDDDIVVFTHEWVPRSAPQYPDSGALTGTEDMRYWSFCVGYGRIATIFDCLADFEIQAEPEPHRIVIGPQYRSVLDPTDGQYKDFSDAVAERGDSLLIWGSRGERVARMLWYRNALVSPHFTGDLRQATPCAAGTPHLCIPASAPPPEGVGLWAPEGRHCTIAQYLAADGACFDPESAVFLDGFESGDASRWASTVSPAQ